jgi:hypothetical protein
MYYGILYYMDAFHFEFTGRAHDAALAGKNG